MNKLDWSVILNINDIISPFTLCMPMISDTVHDSFPIEAIKINCKLRNPRINQKLKNEIKVRDRLFLIHQKHPKI